MDTSEMEIAKINSKEISVFPYNTWEVNILSNDHNPPHFHIMKDGWDVSFMIESGKMLKINSEGEKIDIFNYMKQNVNTWLHSKCSIQPKVTNRENALATWIQIHD